MIRTYRHKGLQELFETGKSRRVEADLHKRCLERLTLLDRATHPRQLDVPGWNFHELKPGRPGVYALKVNGPWRITFTWDKGDAHNVDLEQYH